MQKVSDVVARKVVHDIIVQNLPVGAMLPSENAMLEQFNVSRASLREALRILEAHGLITMKPGPGGGPVVAAVSSRDFGRMSALHYQMARATFRDLVQARMIMEPVMAARAAEFRTDEMLSALDDIRQRTEDDLADPVAFTDHCAEFHNVIAVATGNLVLSLFVRSLRDVYAERVNAVTLPIDGCRQALSEHNAITEAIRAKDSVQAEALMREHVGEVVWQSIDQRYPGLLSEVVDWR